MVYNAFPHFPDPAALVEKLSAVCRPGGRVSIAHGMSREAVNQRHAGAAAVSVGLMSETHLADLFSKWFRVETAVSNNRMYQVVGVKEKLRYSQMLRLTILL